MNDDAPDTISPAQERVRDLVKEMMAVTGLKAAPLATQSGLAATTLTRFMNNPVKHLLSLKTLYKLSMRSGIEVPAAVVNYLAAPADIPIVGYVGAGEQVFPADDGPLGSGIGRTATPPGADPGSVAVVVRGDSMFPVFWDGDVLTFSREQGFDRATCLHNECIVKITNGAIYVKRIEPGRTDVAFNLISYNAPPILNVSVEWAAPVEFHDKRHRRSKPRLAA